MKKSSGEDGIEMIKFYHPDLVITDLTMPGMRGEELIRWITLEHKPASPGIKIIAISGDEQQIVEPVVMAAGGDGFLHKPFEIPDLKKMMKALLVQA